MATHYDAGTNYKHNPYASSERLKVHRRIFPRGSIWPRIITISAIIVAVSFGSLAIGTLVSVGSIRSKATVAMNAASSFLEAAKTGDQAKLKEAAVSLSTSAHGIEDELDQPVWVFSSRLPFIGSDVESIRTLSVVFADFADNALVPMSESGNILALKDFASDNSINFEALPGLLATVDELLPSLNRTARTLESLPKPTIPPLADAMETITTKVVSIDKFITRVRPMFPYLPELFGADGQTRNYLVLAQNNAEIHAIGGFVGSLGVMKITNGKIEMGSFESVWDVLSGSEDPAGATEEEMADFGERANTHHGDHNVIPDFPRVGQLYFNIWNHYHDFELDGVLGFDPVFLQYLLGACGSIQTKYGVTVDETNCAAIMLNQSLFWWQPGECDKFYSEIVNTAMKKILGDLDNLDLDKLIDAVSRAGDEDRCMFWVRDSEAESAVKQAGFGGDVKHDVAKPELGVFISDLSTSKATFYLSNDIEVGEGVANSDGSMSYDVSVTITNNFDPNARDFLPDYLKAGVYEVSGRSETDLYEEIRILAPEGGSISNISTERINTREGTPEDTGWEAKSYQGLMLMKQDLRFDALETAKITFTVTTAPNAVEKLVVRKTPLMPREFTYWNEDISLKYDSWNIKKTV